MGVLRVTGNFLHTFAKLWSIDTKGLGAKVEVYMHKGAVWLITAKSPF